MPVILRPTVAADLPACIAEPLPYRIQCVTAVLCDPIPAQLRALCPSPQAGKIIGLGGIGFRPDGTVVAFAQLQPEAKHVPLALHRAGLMVMDIIKASRIPRVLAQAQEDNPAAERWLLRLGFRPITIAGHLAFVWERTNVL